MRSHFRTLVVVAASVALLAIFLRNVDLVRVGAEIAHARPEWLLLSFAMLPLNLVIRSYRWQYLLEPLGSTRFANAFRATAVGFAASSVLPARAGEVIRPYFLARQQPDDQRMSATGAFATIILERLLDVMAVLMLLASYVFVFGRDLAIRNPVAYEWLRGIAALGAAGVCVGFALVMVLARDPERLGRLTARLARIAPAAAAPIATIVERFAQGLAVVRRPSRLVVALAWSLPLWLSIAAGLWAGAMAFDLGITFVETFPIVALLSIGVAVPTPGAVGGFHAAFRYGATTLFGAPDAPAVGAAIVLHLFSVLPVLLLGVIFAAQAGLSMQGIRRMAVNPQPSTLKAEQ